MRRLLATGLTALIPLALTACSDTADPHSGAAVTKTALADARASVETYYAGTLTEPATDGPAPKAGVKVALISCGQISAGCAVPAEAAQKAAEELGWSLSVYDGKLDPTSFNRGIREAVAEKVDAIILDSIDCGPVSQSLKLAKAEGIKIYGFYAFDCDDPAYGGEAMFDGSTDYGQPFGTDYAALSRSVGKVMADYAIAKTDGKAQVLEFTLGDIVFSKYVKEGFEDRLATCGGCKIVADVPYVGADLGPALTGKAQSALVANPTANVVVVPVDAAAGFMAPAIAAAQARRDLLAIGGEGLAPNRALIENAKGQDVALYSPPEWMGMAALDGVNRILQGQPVGVSGLGQILVDREHNLDPDGTVPLPVDYEAAYRKAWGLR